jgi:predicted regulator of Ras-like GTPase activity (Roadblock/LC7/MglB family)
MLHEAITNTLQQLLARTDSLVVFLVRRQGTALAEVGNTSEINGTALAALVAGVFSATQEVARMVGERQFSILLQQGQNRHIHISLVTDEVMMVVVFEDYQRIGRIRFEARKVRDQLVEYLDPNRSNAADQSEFREVAMNLIDRIFDNR